MDRRESYIYDGAGLLSSFSTGIGGEGARRADEGAAIHISGPNGVMGQHGWVDQMVLSFVDADGDGSGAMTLASRNLYGNAVDQIFATESGSGDVFWALTDHQGTRSTSGTTTIAQHIRYTAFGTIESVTGSLPSSLVPLPSFTGQLYDPDADLLYYRARWYDPQLGKFLSDDPMGFEAGDANVSRLVGNALPVSQDPTGMDDLLPDDWDEDMWPGHRRPTPPRYVEPPSGLVCNSPWWENKFPDPPEPFVGPQVIVTTPDPSWTWPTTTTRTHLQTAVYPGVPKMTVLTLQPPEANRTDGGTGSHVWNVPDDHYNGVGGAQPCILVLICSPGEVSAYHFNTQHDPYATLIRDDHYFDPDSHVLIGAGDNTWPSNSTLNSVWSYLKTRPDFVVDGVVDTCAVYANGKGDYFTYQTAVNLWKN